MKPKPRKIGPLTVWIVGHTQNSLVSEVNEGGRLAVFYKRKDADDFRKDYLLLYKVYKATITRDGHDESKDMQIRELTHRLDAAQKGRIEAQNELAGMRAADETNCETMAENERLQKELADLRQQIHDGKIWNTENPRWTPRTKSALGLAAKEAIAQGATHVGTEHVLLGLLKQQEGIAHRHFLACGMSYDKVKYALKVGRVS